MKDNIPSEKENWSVRELKRQMNRNMKVPQGRHDCRYEYTGLFIQSRRDEIIIEMII